MNSAYASSVNEFNTSDIYNKCIKSNCSSGYEWNTEGTRCIAKVANKDYSNSLLNSNSDQKLAIR